MRLINKVTFDEKLHSGKIAYDNMAKLQKLVAESSGGGTVEVATEGRFGNTFVFLIPCLPFLASYLGKAVKVTVSSSIYEKLGRLNFLEGDYFTPFQYAPEIKFVRLEKEQQALETAKNIVYKDIRIEMSPKLQKNMVSLVGEVFNNALEHSGGAHVLAGRYKKPKDRTFSFACYDTGVGIPKNVRNSLGVNQEMSDSQAIEWALQEGNTTTKQNRLAGQGFSLLQDFARINKGIIRICSGRILYTYDCRKGDPTKGRFEILKNEFYGTLFEMDIYPDRGAVYRYKGEV